MRAQPVFHGVGLRKRQNLCWVKSGLEGEGAGWSTGGKTGREARVRWEKKPPGLSQEGAGTGSCTRWMRVLDHPPRTSLPILPLSSRVDGTRVPSVAAKPRRTERIRGGREVQVKDPIRERCGLTSLPAVCTSHWLYKLCSTCKFRPSQACLFCPSC